MITKVNRGRRIVAATDDSQARVAAQHLTRLQGAEHFHANYPLEKLRPSPANPRRLTLDAAKVTPERIQALSIQGLEGFAEWSKRLEQFVDSQTGADKQVWGELAELAISIFKNGVFQPIIATDTGEIVVGERRWLASQLAGKKNERVILRTFEASSLEGVFRFIENVQRLDLTLPELVVALRGLTDSLLGGCGADNEGLTIEAYISLVGVRKTTAASYRALCLLPDGDPVLGRIASGAISSIREAYVEAVARNRLLARGGEEAEQEGVEDELGQGENLSPPKVEQKMARVAFPLGNRARDFLEGLSKSGLIKDAESEALTELVQTWDMLGERKKRSLLNEVFVAMLSDTESEAE